MINISIVGSRPPKPDAPLEARQVYMALVRKVDEFFASIPQDRGDDDIKITSGNGPGIDQYAQNKALKAEIDLDIRPARWSRYGKPAGHRRNPRIIKPTDVTLAFWDGKSPGTSGSIKIAIAEGKPYIIVYPHSVAPTWQDVLRAIQEKQRTSAA